MDSLSLAALAAELRPLAAAERLGRVVLPARDVLACGWGDQALLISIVPEAPRVHLIDRLPPGPRPEPSLQTHLDSLLRGGEVTAVEAVDFDRVLHLTVDNLDRIGQPRTVRLVIELMGKHSACCVIDEQGVILAPLRVVTHAVNRHRELKPQIPYVPPPGGGRRNPLELQAGEFAALWPQLAAAPTLQAGWRKLLFGLSDPLWEWLCRTAGLSVELPGERADQAVGLALWKAWSDVAQRVREGRFEPCLVRDESGRPTLAYPLPLPGAEPIESLSAGLAAVAAARQSRSVTRHLRGELEGRLKRAASRLHDQRRGLARRQRQVDDERAWQQAGDLILSHLHQLGPRQTELLANDPLDPAAAPLTIALDPALTGPQNAAAYYDRARRARQAGEGLTAQSAELQAAETRLAELAARLAAAETLAELQALAEDLPDGRPPTRTDRPRTERERILRKLGRQVSRDGYQILIGRNAQESEALLSRIAAPSDLWLHVRGAGSGHVVIRTEGRPDQVPASTIEEAAVIAARHSKMKHSDVVPVVWCQRKFVTKIRGGQAGKVVYRNERSLFVNPLASD